MDPMIRTQSFSEAVSLGCSLHKSFSALYLSEVRQEG